MTQERRLEIVVDELVVRGMSPHAARVAATAFEERLTLLARQSPGPIAERAESSRRLPAVEAPAGSPAAVGEAVAGAVWNTLSGGRA
jgi:hypothetical protein